MKNQIVITSYRNYNPRIARIGNLLQHNGERKDDKEKEDTFFSFNNIKDKLTKSIYLSNTCIREFPVSATKILP